MTTILILLYIELGLLDILLILDLRKLLFSFLLTKHNLKGAKKIHISKNRINRFSLSYIGEYAIYQKEFKRFYKLWIWVFAILVPQYIILIFTNLFSEIIALILLVICCLVKMFLNFIVRIQFNSHRISKFDKRY